MLSSRNDTCLELLEKISEIPYEDAPIKKLLATLLMKYTEISASEPSRDIILNAPKDGSTPYAKRRDAAIQELNHPESFSIFEKMYKIENDLKCSLFPHLRLQGSSYDAKAAARRSGRLELHNEERTRQ